MSDRQYDNTNRGALFKNDDKRDDRDPDYRGNINIDGKEFWLDAWLNTAKKSGKKFMALKAKPKMASEYKGALSNPPAQKSKAERDFEDDQIPF
jgi:uncharacterized protein (DUF736 family)